jgi:hypothetical protein
MPLFQRLWDDTTKKETCILVIEIVSLLVLIWVMSHAS